MRILADTNIWIAHFRYGEESLIGLLEYDALACHPLVVGELATGNLAKPRSKTISDLKLLPRVAEASFTEVLHFLEARKLYGRGLHWNDVALLASVVAANDVQLWTRDRKLHEMAVKMGVAFWE